MASRTFVDAEGTEWHAWDVVPLSHTSWSEAARRHLPPPMAEGWLCFECEREKRRVHPIPPGWDSWSDAALSSRCLEADPVPRRAS